MTVIPPPIPIVIPTPVPTPTPTPDPLLPTPTPPTPPPPTSFIDDFLSWRKTQISTNYSEQAKVDVSTLTPEKFMTYSTLVENETTKKSTDIVRTEADNYMVDVIKNNLTDTGRTYIGADKPTLSTEITSAVTGTGYADELAKYSKLWVLSLIKKSNEDSKVYTRIKPTVATEFQALQSGKIMTNIQMRLTHVAVCKKVPGLIPYMYNSATLKEKVKTYLMDPTNMQTWVEDAFNSIKTNLNKINEQEHTDRLSKLKTKLDILDPSFDLSSTVLKEYHSHLYALAAPLSFKASPKIKKTFIKVAEDVLGKIKASSTHPWNGTVTNAETKFGKLETFSKYIGTALYQISRGISTKAKKGATTADSVYTFTKDQFLAKLNKIKGAIPNDAEKRALWEESTTFKLASGLLVILSAGAIFLGLNNYNKSNTMEKIAIWVASVQGGIDGITSIVDAVPLGYKAYTWIGSRLSVLFNRSTVTPSGGSVVIEATSKTNLPKFSNLIKMTKFLKYCTGVLLVVTMGLAAYELVTSVINQEWGMAALSLSEVAMSFALFVFTFFVSTSWSGPACLLLTVALIVVGVVKMFWEKITKFFSGEPEENLYKEVGSTYVTTKEEHKQTMLEAVEKYDKKYPENAIATRLIKLNVINGKTIDVLPD